MVSCHGQDAEKREHNAGWRHQKSPIIIIIHDDIIMIHDQVLIAGLSNT